MTQKLVVPFPPLHLATLEWRDGQACAKRDHSHSVHYSQRGNDTVHLYVVSELYATEPDNIIDVNLQSWTFGLRKAMLLEGTHYVFWSKEHRVIAIMCAERDSDEKRLQTFIPIRLKPRPKGKEPFRDLTTLTGGEYFERLLKHFADGG